MLTLGVVLLILGLIFGLSILTYLGGLLIVIGLIFLVLGLMNRPVGGRRWYY